jgi:uncharacterized membrane protein
MKAKKNAKTITLYTTRGALIGALYVVLTMLATALGLSSSAIQFRISEALCILPIFYPEAIPGLFVGCFLSNLLSGCNIWDIIFGTLATVIGAACAFLLRKLPKHLMWIATLPTILANALIVPPVLIFAYGAPDAFWFLFLTVGLGEAITAGCGGYLLYRLFIKNKFLLK